jgi:hypothetical protein
VVPGTAAVLTVELSLRSLRRAVFRGIEQKVFSLIFARTCA